MQINPNAAASGNPQTRKTALKIALICIPFAGLFIIFIVGAAMFFVVGTSLPYMKRTAKAQPENITISPMSWSESKSSGSSKYPSVSRRQMDGYRISYNFASADGQIISQTDDKQTSKEPSGMAQSAMTRKTRITAHCGRKASVLNNSK